MGDIGDYLQRKAAELGLERGSQLQDIQVYLDKLYPGQCRAVSLNNGVLKIGVSSASLASELRLRQVEIQGALSVYEVAKVVLSAAQ